MKTIDMPAVQKRLIEVIKASGFSNKELAKMIGVTESTASKYVHRNVFPSIETFIQLCIVLNVSSDEILGIK